MLASWYGLGRSARREPAEEEFGGSVGPISWYPAETAKMLRDANCPQCVASPSAHGPSVCAPRQPRPRLDSANRAPDVLDVGKVHRCAVAPADKVQARDIGQ